MNTSKLNEKEQRFMRAARGLTVHQVRRIVHNHSRGVDYATCPKGYMAGHYAEGKISESVIAALEGAERPAETPSPGDPPGPPAVTIEHGKTYRLTKDVINPKPDRRSSDWRDQPVIEKGTRIYGGRPFNDLYSKINGRPTLYSGQFSHQDLVQGAAVRGELYDRIVAALEPVDDFRAFLHEMRELHDVSPEEILEGLCETYGDINRGQIREAAVLIQAAAQAKYEREEAEEAARKRIEERRQKHATDATDATEAEGDAP